MTEKSEAKNRKTEFQRKNINKENQRKKIKSRKIVKDFLIFPTGIISLIRLIHLIRPNLKDAKKMGTFVPISFLGTLFATFL